MKNRKKSTNKSRLKSGCRNRLQRGTEDKDEVSRTPETGRKAEVRRVGAYRIRHGQRQNMTMETTSRVM